VNAFVNLQDRPQLSGIFVVTFFAALWLLGVTRIGLIAGMSMWFADRVFRAEIMLAPEGWCAGRLGLLLAAVAALAIYGAIASLGSQQILPARALDPR
jgi:hypothetical protein